jgi:regulatory protein YycH of two-component signal transduction system YycFG
MNIIQIIVIIILSIVVIYNIWFTPTLDKIANILRKQQDDLIKKNVDDMEKITKDRILRLFKEKQSLESNIATVSEINERIANPQPKKTKQTQTKE